MGVSAGRAVGLCGRGVTVAPVGPISALSPPAASLCGAHLRLRRVSPRHPPQHQQPRHRLLRPAGRSSPAGPVPFPVPVSLPSGLLWSWWRGGAARTALSRPVSLVPWQLVEFSIPEKQYTSWSRALQSSGLHRAWLERDSPITHITFNPKNPSHILLHDTYLLCILDKSLVSLWGRGCLGCAPVGA